MNGKTTLALVLLAVAAGVWLWKGDEWGPKVGLKPSHPELPTSQAAAILDSLTPATLSRVEVKYSSGEPLVLERTGTDSGWKLPGNWPPRKPEVQELVSLLGNLRTRFQAIPVPEAADLAKYGLAPNQKPLVVKLTANSQTTTLTFGDPTPSAGETAFTRPAFVQVDDLPEVLQLGPDVMPVVHRPADAYRRRQLFTDVERVKITASSPAPNPLVPQAGPEAPVTVTLPGEETALIQISRPPVRLIGIPLPQLDGNFTLTRLGKLPEPGVYAKGGEPTIPPDRLADAWGLSAPVRDRAEPGRLRSLLVAVSDLWVDKFENPTEEEKASFDARTGLADSKLAITVKQTHGEPVTVRFGEVAKTGERTETITLPAAQPGMPPQTIPRKIPIEYRFAKMDGNPQVFIVSAEKFPDLFVTVEQLTDPQVARYSADEVQEVTIRHMGSPEVKLMRKKGNPKATNPTETMDRWFLDAKPNPLLADNTRVNELLDQIAGFRSDRPDHTTYPTNAPTPDTFITIVVREKRAEGEADAPPHTFNLQIGKPDAIKRLLPIQVMGWPRVTLVSDKLGPDGLDSWFTSTFYPKTVSGLLARAPLAYRGRKLFDTADTTLSSVTVTATSGGFALSKEGATEWKLTTPIVSEADSGKATQLASTLSALESTEYLVDAPKPDILKEFGLDKPAQVVTLGFTGGRTYKLELGNPRPGKPEVFARLDAGGVFGLPSTVVEQLTTGVVGLLPLRVWATLPEKVTALAITRTGDAAKDSFTLAKDDTNWKLTGAFTAPVTFLNAQPLLTAIGSLQAVKYQAMTVTNAADYGLDKPLLRLKLSFMEKKPTSSGTPPKDEEQSVTKTLIVGGLTPDGSNRYAMLDVPNAPVFVIPAAFTFAAQTPPLELLDRSLLILDPTRTAKVRITSGKPEDAFSLIKDEKGKWSAEGISFAVDAERINLLTRIVSGLPVSRLAAYGDTIKWADFGLEKPGTIISVTLSGDKPVTHTIALGNVDPAGSQFVRVDEGKAVGVIPAMAAENLTRKKFDYADRTLLTFDPTTLAGFNRKQGKDELELAPAAAVGWDVVKPAKYKADQPFVEELADALSKLRAEKVAAYGKKDEVFKQFGLESPAAMLTLTVGDKAEQKTLRLGNLIDPAKPDGDRYAAVDTPNPEAIVGVLPRVLVSKLLTPVVGFRDHTLAKFVDADKAILDRSDRKLTFAKVGAAWKVTEPLAAAAETGELESLIADFGKIRVDTWVAQKTGDLKAFGIDKPEAKWMIFDGDKPVLTLLLGKKTPDGRVYVTTDKSELVGLLDPMLTARVLAEYRQRRPWEVDVAQVEGVEIAKGGAKFELQKAGPAWFDPAKTTDPIDVRAVNELLGTLGALRVDRYAVDKDADPKLFGLENPEMRLTITSPGGAKRVLEIGAVVGGTDGKQRYARVVDKDRSDVFVLTALDTMRLTRDRSAYVMKK
ncbi:MAG TPA: DUF4340 domain-containing protein [Gemmata sp.]|jgi:hypothetical protein|nr:DUF4340 domain-containing protein [Gemmata sp.]